MKKSQSAETGQDLNAQEPTNLQNNNAEEVVPPVGNPQDSAEGQKDAESANLANENAELKDLLQHTRADFENFRKQTDKQRVQAMDSAKYATILKFLPLVDDFSRAIMTYPEELGPLTKNFEKTLAELGLKQIDSKVGTEFDPDYHEAISVDDADGDTEVIAETMRPGYLYEETVLRPAMVKVTHQ